MIFDAAARAEKRRTLLRGAWREVCRRLAEEVRAREPAAAARLQDMAEATRLEEGRWRHPFAGIEAEAGGAAFTLHLGPFFPRPGPLQTSVLRHQAVRLLQQARATNPADGPLARAARGELAGLARLPWLAEPLRRAPLAAFYVVCLMLVVVGGLGLMAARVTTL